MRFCVIFLTVSALCVQPACLCLAFACLPFLPRVRRFRRSFPWPCWPGGSRARPCWACAQGRVRCVSLGRGALAWLVSVSRLLAWLACCVFAALCSRPCASCACCARCSGRTVQTGDFRKHSVQKPEANRKRTESDLSINWPLATEGRFKGFRSPHQDNSV